MMTMTDLMMTATQAPVGFQSQGSAQTQIGEVPAGKGAFYQLFMQKTTPSLIPEELLQLPEGALEGDPLLQELLAALTLPGQVQPAQQLMSPAQNAAPAATPLLPAEPAVLPVAMQQLPSQLTTQPSVSPPQATQITQAPQTSSTPSNVLPNTQAPLQQNGVVQNAATQSDQDSPELLSQQTAQSKPLFEAVENLPVKVGDPAPLDSQSPDFDAKLTQQLTKALRNGEQKLTIQLAPAELGKVVVELTRSKDGSMQIMLHAATDGAANLLRGHSAELSSLLRGNTQTPVFVEVQQPQQSPHSQQQQQQQQQQQHQGQQQQNQQQQNQNRQSSQDFLEQLRLGLFPMQADVS